MAQNKLFCSVSPEEEKLSNVDDNKLLIDPHVAKLVPFQSITTVTKQQLEVFELQRNLM